MHSRLVVVLAVAAAALAPGYAQATGMFCEPGQDWTTVDSGTITDEGWSIVNFSKPEGGEMRIVWTLEGFTDGPALAGTWLGAGPEDLDAGARHHVVPNGVEATASIDSTIYEGDRELSLESSNLAGEASRWMAVGLSAGFSDDDLHLLQFVAGSQDPERELTWSIQLDNCLDGSSPDVITELGDEVGFLSPRDFQGTVSAHLRGAGSVTSAPGATVLVDTAAQMAAEGTPYLDVHWSNRAGELSMDGPEGLSLQDVWCLDHDGQLSCQGWGRYTPPWANPDRLLPGSYTFEAECVTDPLRDPGGSSAGPYIALVPTQLPTASQEEPR